MYHWQLADWPNFTYKEVLHGTAMQEFYRLAGKNKGAEEQLICTERGESLISLLVKEAMKTSAIEGQMISREDVISSIKKNLGFKPPIKLAKDKAAIGIANALVSSRDTAMDKLTAEMMYEWHSSILMGSKGIQVGKWRSGKGPMQIVSGAYGKERIHYEAPPAANMPSEMKQYIQWFNSSAPNNKKTISNPIIRSAIAHLYFESIHPFEDGNGRIGRILAEKTLSQQLGQPVLLSISSIIDKDKKEYYQALKKAQSTLDIDGWIQYFGKIILSAQQEFYSTLCFTVKKSHWIDKVKPLVDTKQMKAIHKMLAKDEDEEFVGGMNARKYISINKVSKATATRDLTDMVIRNILLSVGGGRSTNYQINWDAFEL